MRYHHAMPAAIAYNLGMNQLTLVLPYGLPHPELASDLMKALQAPALAALLSRTSISTVHEVDYAARVLPHEAWLAQALEYGQEPTFAAQAMHGYGLQPEAGARYFIVHPVHIQVDRNHVSLGDMRQLALSETDSRTLFDAARPYCEEIGQPLYYGDAQTWFMRADGWTDLQAASPDAAATQDLSTWMPEGEHARALRRLQNEIQMLWHENSVNQSREERGLKAINSFWVWGASQASDQKADCISKLHTAEAPGWLAALAEPGQRNGSPNSLLAGKDDALLVHGGLIGPSLAQDWGSWLQQMQALEQHWFAPLLAALQDGRIGKLRLVLSHRDGWLDCTTSKNAQRKFWRKHTLNKLKAS